MNFKLSFAGCLLVAASASSFSIASNDGSAANADKFVDSVLSVVQGTDGHLLQDAGKAEFQSRAAIRDLVRRLRPDREKNTLSDLSRDFEDAACLRRPRSEVAALAFAATLLDGTILTPALIDCLIGEEDLEDVATWDALEAWQSSGMPLTDQVKSLAAHAKDTRTHIRLLSAHESAEFSRAMTVDRVINAH